MLLLTCFHSARPVRAQTGGSAPGPCVEREASGCESATGAHGDGDGSAQAADVEVEVVVTGTRTPEVMQRSTLHTGVVSREDAERRGALSVADALEGESGLQVNPNAYAHLGSPSGVMMQGLDAERVLVLRDGERIVGDSGGVVDLEQFSVNDIERIEYVLGPTSSLYGTGALGGVVNIITGGPAAEGFSARTRIEARSLPEYMAGAAMGYRAAGYWVMGSGTYRQSDGVRLFADQADLALAPKKRWEVSTRVGADDPDVTSVAEVNLARTEARGLQTQNVPQLGAFQVDLPDSTQRVQARVRQTYSLGTSAALRMATSAQLFGGESKKDRRDSPLDEVRRREQRLLSAEATTTVSEGLRTWVLGLRVEQEDFEQRLSKTELLRGDVATTTVTEVQPVTLRNGAIYAQLGWAFGEQFTLLPGVRGEWHNRFGGVVAPRLAAAYRPRPGWSMRGSIGRGFRAPSAKEYGFLFDHSFLGYRVVGNSKLEPERSWGVTGDVTVALTDGVRMRVGGFRNWISSMIGTAFTGRSMPGVDDFSYVNIGSASTMGGDASVDFRMSGKLRSQLAYSYLFTHNADDDEPLPGRPSHTVLSAFTYQPLDTLELTVRNRMVSGSYLTRDITTPGFTKLDARVSQRLNEHLWLHVGLLNALDARDDPARPGDQRPIVGRLYVVGLTTNYEEGM